MDVLAFNSERSIEFIKIVLQFDEKIFKILTETEIYFFFQEWLSQENNTENMDVAFNSERSIEDELDRETYGDIMTIAVSYVFMFIYITFSLGKISKLSRAPVESKVHNYINSLIFNNCLITTSI